jgi:hypothetical protein
MRGGWGSGFVVIVSKKWKQPEEQYRKWHTFEEYKIGEIIIPFKLGNIQPVPVDKYTMVVNMIAQHNTISITPGSKPIRYAALASCMTKAANVARKMNAEIHAPKFRFADWLGGNWDFIEELINEIWIDFDVFVYEFEQK